jgi:hypothetical protein
MVLKWAVHSRRGNIQANDVCKLWVGIKQWFKISADCFAERMGDTFDAINKQLQYECVTLPPHMALKQLGIVVPADVAYSIERLFRYRAHTQCEQKKGIIAQST